MKNHLSVCVLGSSSGGNSTVIWNDTVSILIDCGHGPVYLEERLKELDLSLRGLDAVFITHIHSDHVNETTVRNLHKYCIPIHCPAPIETPLVKKYRSLAAVKKENFLFTFTGPEVEISGMTVRAFEVPHDSDGGCFGYTVADETAGMKRKISVATDMAEMTASAVEAMADSDVVVIESNYDAEMLERSGRPIWLKDRIRIGGHLSNEQSAEGIVRIIRQSTNIPKVFALAHISRECNTNALAHACTSSALQELGITNVAVFETYPQRPSRIMTVRKA
ncbi:MAG: MBL fold metallo-hydrolase [Bacteroidota bacterium]